MKHLGILAHSVEGASLCLRAFCQEGFRELGEHQHPDVTLDAVALARSMPAWDAGDYAAVREVLALSVERLSRAGAEFFVCPDNTAHIALEHEGPSLPLPGLPANGRREAIVGIRPEAMELAGEGIEASVDAIEELGSDAFLFCGAELDGAATRLVARVEARHAPPRGTRVHLRPSAEFAPHVFDADSGERLGA